MKAPDGFLNKSEAAAVLGCTVRTLENYQRRNLIPYYKMVRCVFYKREDLLAAVEKCRVPAMGNGGVA